jgi:hypothetical protein
MEFTLTGFRQDLNVRRYVFQGVASDRSKTVFTVGADITLASKHSIPLQELPLLCRQLLESLEGIDDTRLTFTEEHMLGYVMRRTASKEAADSKRKVHKRPPRTAAVGQAWR